MVLPKVVVSTEVLQPATDSVLKGITRSNVLLKNKQDLHGARLSPSQVQLLEEADILIVPDHALTPTLKNWYSAIKKRGGIILSLVEQDEAKTIPLKNGKPDPHIWLDPLRMANLLPVIAETVADYTPEIRDEVHANAQRAARHIRSTLVPEIKRMLKTTAGRTKTASVFAAHPSYRYFSERFAMGSISYHAGSEHHHHGARTQLKMIERIKQLKPDCIVVDAPTRKMERLASELGVPLHVLKPTRLYSSKETTPLPWLKNDYDRLIYATAKRFSDCCVFNVNNVHTQEQEAVNQGNNPFNQHEDGVVAGDNIKTFSGLCDVT